MIWCSRISLPRHGTSNIHTVNCAVYAMQTLQQEMVGEAERTGLNSEDDVLALVRELRNEEEIG